LFVRGYKVMLDKDLAELDGVTTGNLNKAVNRNLDRFPDDFMFLLTEEEFKNLIEIGSGQANYLISCRRTLINKVILGLKLLF